MTASIERLRYLLTSRYLTRRRVFPPPIPTLIPDEQKMTTTSYRTILKLSQIDEREMCRELVNAAVRKCRHLLELLQPNPNIDQLRDELVHLVTPFRCSLTTTAADTLHFAKTGTIPDLWCNFNVGYHTLVAFGDKIAFVGLGEEQCYANVAFLAAYGRFNLQNKDPISAGQLSALSELTPDYLNDLARNGTLSRISRGQYDHETAEAWLRSKGVPFDNALPPLQRTGGKLDGPSSPS